MAARNHRQNKRYGYPVQAVYGSAAVDFDSLPEYMPGSAAPQPQYPEYEPQEPIRIKPVQGHAIKEKRSYKPGLSAFTVLGSLLLVAVTAVVLLANARLTEVTAEHARLQAEYQQLMEDNRLLSVQYELSFELSKLEQDATVRLGMTKPANSQMTYLPDHTEDVVVILDPDLGRSSFADDVSSFFKALLEYIG